MQIYSTRNQVIKYFRKQIPDSNGQHADAADGTM